MVTRRELNAAVGLALAGFVSGGTKNAFAARMPKQDSQGHDSSMPMHSPAGAPKPLIEQPLAAMPESVASLLILNIPPHDPNSTHPFSKHQHTGPIFGYILEGNIESQVDPDPPKTYATGDVFYEPTMHVHRNLRNLSDSQPARILVFQLVPNGQPPAISVK